MLVCPRPPARALALLASFVAFACPGGAQAAGNDVQPRVVLAFLPLAERVALLPAQADIQLAEEPPLAFVPILNRLDARHELSIGLSSAAQGQYDRTQSLLDISQGTRVSLSGYDPKRPGELVFVRDGSGSLFQGWLDVAARAADAPAALHPGLLGSLVPGGAAYAGVAGRDQVEALAAVNRAGRVGQVSIGRAANIAARTTALLQSHRFVVAGLPTGFDGDAAVDQLIKQRSPGELLIVMQTPPARRGPQLLPTGVRGLDRGKPGRIKSQTTHLGGVVAGIDVLPTVLDHLGVAVPKDVKGQPITVQPGRRAGPGLTHLANRLRVVLPRRMPALMTALATWLALLLAAFLRAERRGVRWALRTGALALMWVPSVLLITAMLHPSRTLELLLVSALAFGFAALTERFMSWPRGPIVPAAAALAGFSIDLALGSPLIIRSLLGPNPLFGSRFYGLGNELEATLPALLLIGLGAALQGRGRSRRSVAIVATSGLVLSAVAGAGRLGADVGGVISVGAGTAVMAVMLLPGGVTKRAIVVACGAPVLGLALLAGIDLLTGGNSHFTRTVLHADGSGALWDIVSRRYTLAWRQLHRGFTPAAALIAILAIAVAVKDRERLLAPVDGDPAWIAALAGIATVGIAGTVFNDSGPVLLLFATFLGACAIAYLRGDPRLAEPETGRPGSIRPAGSMS